MKFSVLIKFADNIANQYGLIIMFCTNIILVETICEYVSFVKFRQKFQSRLKIKVKKISKIWLVEEILLKGFSVNFKSLPDPVHQACR